jgi:hypothetical protein
VALTLSRVFSARVMGQVFENMSHADKTLWHSYVYCLLPGAICWLLALEETVALLLSEGMWDPQRVLTTPSRPSPGLFRAAGWELGFLAFDMGVMFVWRDELVEAMQLSMFKQMLVHHGLALLLFPQVIMRGVGLGFVLMMIGTEITSLFVNIRWLLLHAGYDDRPVYYINGAMLVVSFIFIRIVPIPWMMWALFAGSKELYTDFEVVCAYLTVPIPAAFNLYWFTSVIQGVYEAIRGPRKVNVEAAKERLTGDARKLKSRPKTDAAAANGPKADAAADGQKAARKSVNAAAPDRPKENRTK